MELFLPGIATLLIIGLIVFLILPRMGAPVLATLSIILLAYGVYNHIKLFSSEYRYSTWQDRLKEYSSFIIIGVLILSILMYLGYLFSTQGASALPVSNVPVANATEAVNAVNGTVNSIVNSITNTVSNATNTVANTIGLGNNSNKTNSKNGLLTNLSKILNTGNNRKPNNSGIF
jgi:hypothetical protein